MRKTFYLLFITTIFSGQLLAQDSRVVYSEDFEDASDVLNWKEYTGAPAGSTLETQNPSGGVAGSGALELSDGGFDFLTERPITAVVGSQYLLTLDVKTLGWDNETDNPLALSLVGIDANPTVVYINNSIDFTTITIGGTATGSAGHIQIIGTNVVGGNKVWLDNISLVANPSFALESAYDESFETDDDVTNWGEFVTPTQATVSSYSTTGGVAGSGALEISDPNLEIMIERAITATVGENYLLTLDIKTLDWAETRPLYITLDGIDANPKIIFITGLTDFTTISLAGTATSSSGYIRIEGRNGFIANKIWIDNISLRGIDMESVAWTGIAWNSGADPTITDNVVIDAPLTITSDLGVKGIEVTSSGSITVESGASLAIMESASGDATIKRNTTGNAGYSIIGAPVSGADLSVLSADYLQTWDGSAWAAPFGLMMPGVGYFAGYDAATPEVSLMGPLVSGDQPVAVSTAGDGFNIVANPYASAISIAAFLAGNPTNIDASVYLWNDGGTNVGGDRAGDYVTVNSVGVVGSEDLSDGVAGQNTTAANTDIGSMQGFLVHATADANVNFTPLMQTIAAGANADDNFYRTTEQATLKLALNGAHYNEVLFGFRSDATLGVDRMFDAVKLIGNKNFAFYSKIDEEKFAIQGLPELNGEMEISLGYDVKEAGTYELSIKEIAGITEGYKVIADYNGSSYTLSDKSASLNLAAGQGIIELTLTKAILSTEVESAFKVYNDNGQLNIQVAASIENANIQIFDLTGKVVAKLTNERFINGMWSKQIDLKSGDIYILKVQSKESILTQKFIY